MSDLFSASSPTELFAQTPAAPGPVAPVDLGSGRALQIVPCLLLVVPPQQVWALAQDGDWAAQLEQEPDLAARLVAGTPFVAAGRQLYVLGATPYARGRVVYQCAAVATGR